MAKETHEFQAETRELLDLMIHSIYTNHEIFLRELISNASDALDKVHFESLTNRELLEGDDAFEIFLVPDKDGHTFTIADNGIGMTKDELVDNIGTIAKSGTKAFLDQLKKAKENRPLSLLPQIWTDFKKDELANIYRGKGTQKEKESIYELLFSINPSQNKYWDQIKE